MSKGDTCPSGAHVWGGHMSGGLMSRGTFVWWTQVTPPKTGLLNPVYTGTYKSPIIWGHSNNRKGNELCKIN